jgi:predicted DNA-binding transcriptional regulator YafY
MNRPTTRVLALLELLQTHGRLSGAELAERLGVDRRTVRRYIVALEELGIPVTTEQGRHGGYLLVPGFKLPPLMFNDEEAVALALGLLSVEVQSLLERNVAVHSAQAKLERVLPEKLKQRMQALREHARVVPQRQQPGWNSEVLLALSAATQQRQRVQMHYRSPRGEHMQRELDPYGLVFHERHWYVSGWCPLRKDLRSFRLDRLSEVILQPQHFARPERFDAAEHLKSSMEKAWPKQRVSVLLLNLELQQALEWLPQKRAELQPQPEGLLLNTSTDSLCWFARWLSQLPCDYRILEPQGLKDAARAQAQRLLAACGQ